MRLDLICYYEILYMSHWNQTPMQACTSQPALVRLFFLATKETSLKERYLSCCIQGIRTASHASEDALKPAGCKVIRRSPRNRIGCWNQLAHDCPSQNRLIMHPATFQGAQGEWHPYEDKSTYWCGTETAEHVTPVKKNPLEWGKFTLFYHTVLLGALW